jgi:hypothetical protein
MVFKVLQTMAIRVPQFVVSGGAGFIDIVPIVAPYNIATLPKTVHGSMISIIMYVYVIRIYPTNQIHGQVPPNPVL